MLHVSLKDFVETGRVGPIGLGAARSAVASAFGPPDDREARARSDEGARIWKYGDVELHFERSGPEAEIWLIQAERFSQPGGGRALEVDPWIVSGALSLGDAERELQRAGIDAYGGPYEGADRAFELRTRAGVSMLFEGGPESPRATWKLTAIWASRPAHARRG